MNPLKTLAAWAMLAASLGFSIAAAEPAALPATEPLDAGQAPGGYIRVADREGRITLELAVRRFVKVDGAPAIWLVGVTHIGEADYYSILQHFLDDQPLVLYEGIGRPEFMDPPAPDDDDAHRAQRSRSAVGFAASMTQWYRLKFGAFPASLKSLTAAVKEHQPRAAKYLRAASTDAWGRPLEYERDADTFKITSLGSDGQTGGADAAADIAHEGHATETHDEAVEPEGMQNTLARALGLRFQLDAIDYDRDHFVNSDMPLRHLQQRFSQEGAGEEKELDQLLSTLQGTGFLAGVLRFGLNVVAVSPRLQAYAKLLLIETIGHLGEHIDQLPQLSESQRKSMAMLIQDRNQIVVDDLKKVLAGRSTPKSIAVFYGAAHLRDMEKRLVDQLGYKPCEQFWLSAFSVQPAQAGLTQADVQMLRGAIQSQFKLPAKP